MEQKKINPNNGLRALIDELYAKIAKLAAGISPLLAHAWADAPGASVPIAGYGVLAQASITLSKYDNVRVIGTGDVLGEVGSPGTFIPAVGFALSPGTPVEVYAGDGSGIFIAKGTESSGTAFLISYLITGLTPGQAYNVAIMGTATGTGPTPVTVSPHGIQVDAQEEAS